MRTFCLQQWRLIVLLVFLALWIGLFPIWSRWIASDPLNAAISLSPAGTVEEVIQIRIPERYSLDLIFNREGIPLQQLKDSIGESGLCEIEKPCSKGVPVPIRWSLKNMATGDIASSGEIESKDAHGWSSAHVYRYVGIVKVQPGKYAFKAEVLHPVPELAHLKVHIAIHLQPKASTSWQIGLVWWGSIGQFLAWPAGICVLFVLLERAILAMRSNRQGHAPST